MLGPIQIDNELRLIAEAGGEETHHIVIPETTDPREPFVIIERYEGSDSQHIDAHYFELDALIDVLKAAKAYYRKLNP